MAWKTPQHILDRNREWRTANPEQAHRSKTETQLRRFYGINSIEERDEILASQGNACAVCRRTDCTWGKGWLNVWHIDHKHGEVGTHRGILCARCNIFIGVLETSRHLLETAFEYLHQF